jgi:hypothetical protein
MKMDKATSNRQQATSRQATKKKKKKGEWVKGTSISLYLVPCSLYLLKRFSQIRKKSAVICVNLRHLSACCLNQDSQDEMKQINQYFQMSRRGLNMYNPLQAKHSWGYKMTTTLSELRSSSICYHTNHLNQINHSSDKKERKDESSKAQAETCLLVYSFTYNEIQIKF